MTDRRRVSLNSTDRIDLEISDTFVVLEVVHDESVGLGIPMDWARVTLTAEQAISLGQALMTLAAGLAEKAPPP
jgi:hypothetical protein